LFVVPFLLSACSASSALYPGVVLADNSSAAAELRIVALGDAGSFSDTTGSNQQLVAGGNLIVYGHHPLYSSGAHGEDLNLIILLEANGADLYLAGHDHNLEIRKPINGVTYVVSGAGGKLRNIAESGDPQTVYADSLPGAIIIDVTSTGYTLTVRESQTPSEPFTATYPWN